MQFRLTVKVNPGTSRQHAVWKHNFLKVNLKSPPENGRANEELIRYLSEIFRVDSSRITIDRGEASPEKELVLEDVDRESLVRRINELRE